jgi:hypothetical protein
MGVQTGVANVDYARLRGSSLDHFEQELEGATGIQVSFESPHRSWRNRALSMAAKAFRAAGTVVTCFVVTVEREAFHALRLEILLAHSLRALSSAQIASPSDLSTESINLLRDD